MQSCIEQIEILEGDGRPCCAATTFALEKQPAFYDMEPDYTSLLGVSNLPRDQDKGKRRRRRYLLGLMKQDAPGTWTEFDPPSKRQHTHPTASLHLPHHDSTLTLTCLFYDSPLLCNTRSK